MSDDGINRTRRRLLAITTGFGVVGAVGAATPFVLSMLPSARARAAGAPVEVDISKLEPGQQITVAWRGKPVWVLYRTPAMIARLKTKSLEALLLDPDSKADQQPPYVDKQLRSIKPDHLVLVGICTHLGCSPLAKLDPGAAEGMSPDWPGGYFCPCHGSKYDLAGRVYKNVPAPLNLEVPPHAYTKPTLITVGVNPKQGAA